MKRTREERVDFLIDCLEEKSSLFSEFFELGQIHFNETIPTACIKFFEKSRNPLSFEWNPKFFDFSSDYKNLFILCHEILHMLLKHGVRGKDLGDTKKANIDMDLSINHMLVDVFGFKRYMIEDWQDICWVDTVFKKEIDPQPSFEDYYKIPREFYKEEFLNPGFILDDHGSFMGKDPELDDIIDKLSEEAPSQGHEEGFLNQVVNSKPKKRKKFEDLVKNLTASLSSSKQLEDEDYSWSTIDRRIACFAQDLPCIANLPKRDFEERFLCYFFIDNSGSCNSFIKRFVDAATSIDDKVFEIKLFSFDTAVKEIQGNTKTGFHVTGGGGTSFSPVIKKINQEKPDVAFILTDGFAEPVNNPQMKSKTHWFITEKGRSSHLSKAGRVWKLSQFE